MLRIPLRIPLLTFSLSGLLIAGCSSNPNKDFTQAVISDASTFLDETTVASTNETEKEFIRSKLARLNQDLDDKEFSSANRTAEQLELDVATARQTEKISNIKNEISRLENEIKGLYKEMEWRTPLTLEQVLPIPETK